MDPAEVYTARDAELSEHLMSSLQPLRKSRKTLRRKRRNHRPVGDGNLGAKKTMTTTSKNRVMKWHNKFQLTN